jgi:protein TonB
MTAQAPRLVGDFLTDADYPKLARRAGQDGRVLLTVFIEADGHVREARVVKGSYPVLNNVALEKIRTARFEPARDAAGRPVPAKVLLPIRFELN